MAKGGAVSCIVPMVSHVDHTRHDCRSSSPSRGLADLRPVTRASVTQVIIDSNHAHPTGAPCCKDYFDRARSQGAQHTTHLLGGH